jgi:hypothetical protein
LLFSPCRTGRRTDSDNARTPQKTPSPAPQLEPPFSVEVDTPLYTVPTLEAINKMSPDERAAVRDFVVGHPMYGKVHFKGPIDMTRLAELHYGKVRRRLKMEGGPRFTRCRFNGQAKP